MSEADVDKGSRGLREVVNALEGMTLGIVCLTPENLEARWILYEAGALSKTIDDKTRLCTFLLGGLRPQDIKAPLGMFQATRAEKVDTRRLVHTINKTVSEEPLSEGKLDQVFEAMWPNLEGQLRCLPPAETDVEFRRSVEEMVAEILEITRADANRRKQTEWMDEYTPTMKEFFPLVTQIIAAAKQAGALPVGQARPTAPSVEGGKD
jgi:hypothetical protein